MGISRLSWLWVALVAGNVATAAERWGDLTMTFRLDGERPRAKEQTINQKNTWLVDPPDADSLVVHPKNRGIANVAVWLRDKIGPEQIHPEFAAAAQKPVVVSIRNRQYVPRVFPLRTTQVLAIADHDQDIHAPATDFVINPANSLLISGKGSIELHLRGQEVLPGHIRCTVHPSEHCWVIIRDNPYVGVSDENGQLTIKKLPVGQHTFALWHERPGPLTSEQTGGKPDWPKGRMTVDIQPGENNLGVFELSPNTFRRD